MEAPADIFVELRSRVLELDPTSVGLNPKPGHSDVWGAIMELGFPEAVASLVGLADGTTSLYFSNGGGMIGGGGHETVRVATARWLVVAAEAAADLQPSDQFPLPDQDGVRFVVLTFGGRLAGGDTDSALRTGRSPLSPLFVAGHEVITQFRAVTEAQNAKQ